MASARITPRRSRAGVSLVEAVVSVSIFVVLVGSVAYAARIALTVMTESMQETKLLYRVRRALDHLEEELTRCSRISVVALTDDGFNLAALENWFEQKEVQFDGQPLGDAAEEVREDLTTVRDLLQQAPPDFPPADYYIDRAYDNFTDMVTGGLITGADVTTIGDALTTVRNNVRARVLAGMGGTGTGIANAWIELEPLLVAGDPTIAAEPLVSADQVLFREVIMGGGGREYRPPLDQPPASYYLRPAGDGDGFELVFYDGTRSIVIAQHLTNIRFDRTNDLLKITMSFNEEQDGVTILRTEVRSVLLRAP